MKKYDIIIIGSGLGGLMCGNMLSREGYNVCILEKEHQIGGCLQTFTRDNCIFDSGMHYIGSVEPGNILYRILSYTGIIDNLKLRKLDVNGFDRFSFDNNNTVYSYAMGYDNFTETLAAQFPKEKDSIAQYCSGIQKIIDTLNVYNLREITSINTIPNEYLTQSASAFISSITSNPRLQNILAACSPLYAGKKDKSPVYIHATIFHSFVTNAYRFIDGGDQLARLLAETIIKNGGDIITKHKVTGFMSDSERLTAVEVNNRVQFSAKYFISNIHPVNTLNMIDSPQITKPYRKRITSLPNTISSFTVFISLKKNTFKYINYNYYHANSDPWSVADYTEESWPKGYMLITPATASSSEYADSVILLTYMNYQDVKQWENTTVGKRGNDYLQFKERKAEKLLNYVEQQFPGLRSKILNYYTATPLTYRDYTGTVDGSMYGIEKDCNNPFNTYVPTKTKIPNLYLTGQNTNMHGVLGVSVGAMLTCAEFIGLNNLIAKIKKN